MDKGKTKLEVSEYHLDLTALTDEQKQLIAGSQYIQDLIREVTHLQAEHDRIDAELESAEARLEVAVEGTTAANEPPPPARATKDEKADANNKKTQSQKIDEDAAVKREGSQHPSHRP